MLRRDLLKAIALFPSMSIWSSRARAQTTFRPTRFIDVHCHAFNANDIPVERFVEHVMLPDLFASLRRKGTSKLLIQLFESHQKAEGAFIALLAATMREAAPSVSSEMAEVTKYGMTLTQKDLIARRKQREVGVLTRILKLIWEPLPGHHYFLPTVQAEIRARIRVEAGTEDPYEDPRKDIEALPFIANNLYYDLGAGTDKPIGFMLRWALRFGRNRFELVDELSNTYSGRAALLTPAFVDFELWLDENWKSDKATREFQLQQIEVMAAIARRPKGPRAHGFMCFDPLRQAYFAQRKKLGLTVGSSPLEIVQTAIANGFIGVKLYPPMGFRPFNNNNIPFPAYVTDKTGLGPNAGSAIETALDELYKWCAENQVPIMAHANDSNGSHPNYGARGSPDNWRALIENDKYKDLRINLAHFGGFEEAFDNPIGNEVLEESWEWKVMQIWKELPQAQLYADISYFDEILPLKFVTDPQDQQKYVERRKRVTEIWKEQVRPAPMSVTRLMYGSDWIMLGGETGLPSFVPWDEVPKKFYPDIVAEFLSEVKYKDFEIDRILFKNAVEFLGLSSSHLNGTRGRLEKFHGPVNATWLTAFDS